MADVIASMFSWLIHYLLGPGLLLLVGFILGLAVSRRGGRR
jgi:hypothetical protein